MTRTWRQRAKVPNIRWKSVGVMVYAAFFAYMGLYLVGPDHVVKSYVRWGYPPWSHFVAGALFLSAAILLPFHRTCQVGATIACCVLTIAAATCALHGDYAHAVQGPPIIALLVWIVLTRPTAPAAAPPPNCPPLALCRSRSSEQNGVDHHGRNGGDEAAGRRQQGFGDSGRDHG